MGQSTGIDAVKYVYIMGLEHSGTTLLSHLLSQGEEVIALGEVAQFFSADHMHNYMSKWGAYPDVRLCSCGSDWEDCEFWGRFYSLSGLESNASVADKYKELLGRLDSDMNSHVFVDSSKILGSLQDLNRQHQDGYPSNNELYVLFMIKDARSFVSSISNKNHDNSISGILKTYNWWSSANRKIHNYLQKHNVRYRVVLYEQLCFDTEKILSWIYTDLGVAPRLSVDVAHNNSHIVLGNKDFVSRNRDAVKYDYAWFLKNRVSLGYQFHVAARRFNEKMYNLIGAPG